MHVHLPYTISIHHPLNGSGNRAEAWRVSRRGGNRFAIACVLLVHRRLPEASLKEGAVPSGFLRKKFCGFCGPLFGVGGFRFNILPCLRKFFFAASSKIPLSRSCKHPALKATRQVMTSDNNLNRICDLSCAFVTALMHT